MGVRYAKYQRYITLAGMIKEKKVEERILFINYIDVNVIFVGRRKK